MQELPINAVLQTIRDTLLNNTRAVLQAPPGAGKTTAVPIALLEQPWLGEKQIIMLEPRRLAARNAAARMAYLLGEKVGQTIGYQIRQDSRYSDKTKILVVTEGILTRKLQADPELSKAALVIFDEFHERSIHADLSLALSLQSQQLLREELKLLVMSATLNTSAIADLLGDAPIIQSEGRSYPVDMHYLERSIPANKPAQLLPTMEKTLRQVIHEHSGNCLVFLPGVREIMTLHGLLKQRIKTEGFADILLAPLHGSLTKSQQDLAISPPPEGKRKIVLATNIAETSLTIEGINCVVDSGLERNQQYNPASGMNRLLTQAISRDSATQRAGRAGRLSAGSCYRMWTQQQHNRLNKHASAELLHSDLSSLVLETSNWGASVDELQWMDAPPVKAVTEANRLLLSLKAIDKRGNITRHGKNMLQLGCHPRLAHMMLASVNLAQPYHACLIAGLLTEKDIYLAGSEKSFDLHDRIKLLATRPTASGHGIDKAQIKRVTETANDFYKRLQPFIDDSRKGGRDEGRTGRAADSSKDNIDDELSGVILAFAYPDRIARQRSSKAASYLLSNGKGANIPEFLQHQLYEYIVIANLDAQQGEARIYLAAEITLDQIEDFFHDLVTEQQDVSWNDTEQRAESKQRVSIGNIILREKPHNPEDKTATRQCLLQAISEFGLQCLNWTDQARQLQQRVQFINSNKDKPAVKKLLEQTPLPDLSDEKLRHSLDQWLQPFLKNENSFKQCQKLDLHNILLQQLSWQQQQLIEKLAPEKITVPSGSAIRIDYSDSSTPVLAVRLQEVFGLNETPSVLNGKVKLMMHLLSPARRPMQVTQDLHSFWQTTYHEVKKELRGKYKKHYWPDDPFTAQATSKTKKQMNK